MSFFVAGGTVPPGSPSYVERSADRELFEALLAGEYCYVLNSRQMGKSSLAVRTIAKLNEAGVRTAFVDLTKIGGTTSTPEQWYAGLLLETGRALGLRSEAATWVRDHRDLGPAQRLLSFLQERALAEIAGPVVVLVDEIDAVRSLPFSTDEFFAGLRQIHNGRAADPDLERLTICLLGAALPSDLIRDVRITPFNVGLRVELRDFTAEEARPFGEVVGAKALGRVLAWTGGHPFLTQSLCAALAGGGDVEALVRERYLDARSRETDTNLADVANRLLGNGDPDMTDGERADALSLYERMLKGRPVPDDEANPAAARIKMSGVARVENGALRVRNRIYAQAFDRAWVGENMPGQELRRQRRAFWRGVVRTSLAAGAVLAVVGSLAWIAVRNERRAIAAETKARYDAYTATMRNMDSLAEQNNLDLIDAALERLKDDPSRGWEWGFWHRYANWRVRRILLEKGGVHYIDSPSKRFIASWSPSRIELANLKTGKTRTLDVDAEKVVSLAFDRQDRRLLLVDSDEHLREYDLTANKVVRDRMVPGLAALWDHRTSIAPNGRSSLAVLKGGRAAVLDVESLKLRPLHPDLTQTEWLIASPDRRRIYAVGTAGKIVRGRISVLDAATGEPIGRYEPGATIAGATPSPDGRFLLICDSLGDLSLLRAKDGKLLWRRRVIDGAAMDPSVSPNGQLMFYGSRTRETVVRRFDEGGLGKIVRRFPESSSGGFLDNETLYTTYWHIDIHSLTMDDPVATRALPQGLVWARITSDGGLLMSTAKQNLRVDLTQPGLPSASLPGPGETVPIASMDGCIMLRKDASGAKVIESKGGRQVGTTFPLDLPATMIEADADRTTLAALANGRKLDIYDLNTGQRRGSLTTGKDILHFRFLSDGRILILTGGGPTELWSKGGRQRIWSRLFDPTGAVWFSLSPDGKRVVLVGDDDSGHIVDLDSGREIAPLVGHSQSVTSADWSLDGRRIVTGSDDRTVRLWDAATGQELGILGRHEMSVWTVGFLPGGTTIATAGPDGSVKFWSTEARR